MIHSMADWYGIISIHVAQTFVPRQMLNVTHLKLNAGLVRSRSYGDVMAAKEKST